MSDLELEAKKYIINPKTNRRVKVGSKLYKKLLKDKITESASKPLPPLTGVEEEKDGEYSPEPEQPEPEQPEVIDEEPLSIREKTDTAAEVISRHRSGLEELSGDELEDALEQMILAKVKAKRASKAKAKPKPKPKAKRKYRVKPPPPPEVFDE